MPSVLTTVAPSSSPTPLPERPTLPKLWKRLGSMTLSRYRRLVSATSACPLVMYRGGVYEGCDHGLLLLLLLVVALTLVACDSLALLPVGAAAIWSRALPVPPSADFR